MARGQTVLIVEDDSDLRRIFRTALQFGGYEVLEAGDGLVALRALDRDGIDLVVLDLGLPVLSGHIVLQEVAAQAATRDVPVVVVVTGTPGPHDLPYARHVLVKPITPERLVRTVQQCLAEGASTSGA